MRIAIKKEIGKCISEHVKTIETPVIPRIGERMVFEVYKSDDKGCVVDDVVYFFNEDDELEKVDIYAKF